MDSSRSDAVRPRIHRSHRIAVAPNTIHHHVKTFREQMKNMHYFAPEFEMSPAVTTAADIFAFGICALEMAAVGFRSDETAADRPTLPSASMSEASGLDKPAPPSTSTSQPSFAITPEIIQRTLDVLENPLMRVSLCCTITIAPQSFISSCLRSNPEDRPKARQLLFHPILFEVHSLKLQAAHVIADSKAHETLNITSTAAEADPATVLVSTRHAQRTMADVAQFEVDKVLEDVRNGI